MKTSIENSEHYSWGAHCSGWHLVKTDNLSVIQESMPPMTEERRHYHNLSQQFFYILKGEATFYLEDRTIGVGEGEGLHIIPKTVHQIKNNSATPLHFLVISQPTTIGDRFDQPITENL